MNQKQAKKRAKKIIEASRVFVLSTVDGRNRPQSRYMGAKLVGSGMTIYMETYKRSRKTRQIAKNPRAQLLFSTPDYSEVVTVSGKASMDRSVEMRKKIWNENPASADYFRDYDDPNLGLIKFESEMLEYYGPQTGLESIQINL